MIELHPEKKMPLYEQLYNALAQDIRSGALQPGKALPGRRTMAAQLGISTNTVDTAYQMLAAEGLAVTRPRSGFFVQETGAIWARRFSSPCISPRCSSSGRWYISSFWMRPQLRAGKREVSILPVDKSYKISS